MKSCIKIFCEFLNFVIEKGDWVRVDKRIDSMGWCLWDVNNKNMVYIEGIWIEC